jgi:hypothetical protein
MRDATEEMRIKGIMLAAALGVLLTGCGTTSHEMIGKARTPLPPSRVKVYDAVPTNSEVIATVFVNNYNGTYHYLFHPETRLLKEEAARLGANGLVVGPHTIRAIHGYDGSGTAFYFEEAQ